MPCPRCHGMLVRWPDAEIAQNRTIKHIRKKHAIPLVAREHTAQVTTIERAEIEDKFKGGPAVSPVNLLSCSPTLEMGIDVGGLDAVILRNVPPRPDNYAQRGGRAGRRSRVGMVVGYARSTPHDQYFYDKPREMIAGEVPAPALNLGNRDVVVRHLYAIAFGATNPGLSGKMVDYVDASGNLKEEAIAALVEAVKAQMEHAVQIAAEAWGADVLTRAQLTADELRTHLQKLPQRVRRVFESTARQVIELRSALDRYTQELQGRFAGVRAGDLVARLLGIPTDQRRQNQEADDRSAGYPLRRFAEFGLLPGYEFPSEPACAAALGRSSRGGRNLRHATVWHWAVSARGPRVCPVPPLEGDRSGHLIPVEPAVPSPHLELSPLRLVPPALRRRRAALSALPGRRPRRGASRVRLCRFPRSARRTAHSGGGRSLRRPQSRSHLPAVGWFGDRPLDRRARLGFAAEPQ